MLFNRIFQTPLRWPFIWAAAVVLLTVVHLWTVNYFSVNVPYMDDFTFLVDVIHWKKGEKSWQQFLDILLTPHGPHNEHMLVFGRLTAIVDYLVEGQLNFKSMIWVGNALLMATFLLLVHVARQAGIAWFQTIPVALLLFQPQYHEVTMSWVICAVQHLPALFLAFLSFYLLSRPSSVAFGFSFPIALLAYFSNGNGFAVLITGLILLLVDGTRQRLYLWVIFSALAICLSRYLANKYGATTELTNLTHPIRVLGGFFLVSGSIGVLFTRSLMGLSILGLLMQWGFGTIAVLLLFGLINSEKKTKDTSPARQSEQGRQVRFTWFRHIPIPYKMSHSVSGVLPLLACYLYVLITLAGIAFARSTGWPYGLLVPRFIWFATMLVVTGYLLTLVAIVPAYRPFVSKLAIVISLGFCFFSYWYTLDEVMNRHKSLVSDMNNWREDELLISVPPDEQLYDRYYSLIIKEAVLLGVYKLPLADFNVKLAQNGTAINGHMHLVQDESIFKYVHRQHLELTLPDQIFPATLPGLGSAYLLLRSAQHTFVWPVDQSPLKLEYFLINGKPRKRGNVVTVYADMLPASAYRLGVLYKQNHRWKSIYSNESILIDHKH